MARPQEKHIQYRRPLRRLDTPFRLWYSGRQIERELEKATMSFLSVGRPAQQLNPNNNNNVNRGEHGSTPGEARA